MSSFASDNTAPIHPVIMDAMIKANQGYVGAYGKDPITEQLKEKFADLLGKQVTVWPVFNGSACNGLALQAACAPYRGILCHEHAPINQDEAGLPEFFTAAKIIPLKGENGKITPESCDQFIQSVINRQPHSVLPQVISLTQCTEMGTVYSIAELRAFRALANRYGLYLHMDGARLGNAVACLKVSLAEMMAELDVVSFGGTKAGGMLAEAVLVINPKLQEGFAFRHKRVGQLPSKARFISAQLLALLEDELWLSLASHANAMAQALAKGLSTIPQVSLLAPAETNVIFVKLPIALVDDLRSRGHQFYAWPQLGTDVYRLVTSWATRSEEVDEFLQDAQRAMS